MRSIGNKLTSNHLFAVCKPAFRHVRLWSSLAYYHTVINKQVSRQYKFTLGLFQMRPPCVPLLRSACFLLLTPPLHRLLHAEHTVTFHTNEVHYTGQPNRNDRRMFHGTELVTLAYVYAWAMA